MPTPSDTARTAASQLRRSIRAALLLRAVAIATVGGLLAAGIVFFLIRLASPDIPPLRLLPWTLLAVAAPFAALALRALRRIPPESSCLAAIEAASPSGGLLLCANLPGADSWATIAPTIPEARFSPSPALRAALPASAAFCALALALPASVFRAVIPPPPDPTGILTLANEQSDRLADLVDNGNLPDAKAAELGEWLERIRESAIAGNSSQTSLLEALDHVTRQLDNAALPFPATPSSSAAARADEFAAQLAKLRSTSSWPRALQRKMAEILAQLPPDLLRKYAQAMAAQMGGTGGDKPLSLEDELAISELLDALTPDAMADLARLFSSLSPEDLQSLLGSSQSNVLGNPPQRMTPEEFRRYLEAMRELSSLSSNELARLLRNNPDCCPQPKLAPIPSPGAALDALLAQHSAAAAAAANALANCPGGTGAGEPSRGPGDAPLGFTGQTGEAASDEFVDAPISSRDGLPDPSAAALIGTSAVAPDVAPAAAPVTAGALDTAAPPGEAGATRNAPVLPRHRDAVRRYFGDNPPQ